MTNHNLRYFGLGAYTGLVALWTALGKLEVSEPTVAVMILAPIVVVITLDIYKNRNNTG